MPSVDVTLLVQHDCGFCEDAKRILGRLKREYPLDVQTVDLATPQGRELASGAGVLFAPGILLDGEAFSYGRPSERKLRKAFARRLASS